MTPLRRRRVSRPELAFAGLILGGMLAGGLWFRRQLQIDRCLDAGGRWDYRNRHCIGARY